MEFCKALVGMFGKFYDNVGLEKIDGVTMPVWYNGTDFVNLHPKDNQCDVAYVRQIGDSDIELKDLGGCSKTSYMVSKYKFVHWSNQRTFNSFAKLQLFNQIMKPYGIELLNVNTQSEQVYASETNKGKYIKLKNINYLSVDFLIKAKIDYNCKIEEC
jgi:hypothetical protein